MSRRFQLAISHLLGSAALVGAFAAWLLLAWYPGPLARMEGLFAILFIVVVVDVCLGPLCTAIIASDHKTRRELMRDVSIIVAVQLSALGYGLYTTFVTRPAYVVFNADRFDIVAASEVVFKFNEHVAGGEFAQAPILGPKWVYAEPPASQQERLEIVFSALNGGPDQKNLAHLYRPWPHAPSAIRARVLPLERIVMTGDEQSTVIAAAARRARLAVEQLAYVPLVGHDATGIVLLRASDLAIVEALLLAPAP